MPVLVLPLSRRRVFNVGPAIWQHLRYSPALSIPRRTFASTQDQPVLEDADTTTLKYTLHIAPSTSPQVPTVRVVCIADTHNLQDRISLPPGDILIHAGDLTNWGTESELSNALKWLSSLPYPHKVFVAGNHDHALAIPERRDALLASFPDLIYLEDSSVTLTVNGHPLKLFGSPRTPKRGEGVFQYLIRSTEWPIPPDTDIVITHGPPKFHLDDGGQGCNFLLAALWRIRPPLHVFGHIHDGRGVAHLDWSRNQRHYEEDSGRALRLKPAAQIAAAEVPRELRHKWFWQLRDTRPTVLVNASWMGQLVDSIESAIVVHLPLRQEVEVEAPNLSVVADPEALQETQPAPVPALPVIAKAQRQGASAPSVPSMTVPISAWSSDAQRTTSMASLLASLLSARKENSSSQGTQSAPAPTLAVPVKPRRKYPRVQNTRPSLLANASRSGQLGNSIESAAVIDLSLLQEEKVEAPKLLVVTDPEALQETQPASVPALPAKPKPHRKGARAPFVPSMTVPIAAQSSGVQSLTSTSAPALAAPVKPRKKSSKVRSTIPRTPNTKTTTMPIQETTRRVRVKTFVELLVASGTTYS